MNLIFARINFLLFIGALMSCSNVGSSSNSQAGPSYPAQFMFAGVGAHGIGDPSLAQDGTTSRVWLSYSAVDPSPTWPTVNLNLESTRLAYSDTNGLTWTDTGSVINAITEHSLPLTPPNNDGSWVNETSQIIYDPGALTGQHYKLIWHHYLVTGNSPQFADGWLAMKMSDSPTGLASATEIKLFAGSGYDSPNASTSGSPLYPPVAGAPQIFLNSSIPALSACTVFSEPGMYANSTAIYLTATCSTSSDHVVFLLRCSSPCSVSNASSWTYIGALFNDSTAAAFGFDSGFTASSLFQGNDGNVYISVTPVQNSGAPFPNYYEGCYIFKFLNLDAGTLASGPNKIISGRSAHFSGACAYNRAVNSGVMYLDLDTSVTNQFQVFSSGINF